MAIGNLRPFMAIIYNKELYSVLSCEHTKIARGPAFCRAKIKNLKTFQILECSLRDSDNIEQAFVDKRKLQYLYTRGEHYYFLDLETYEDLILHKSRVIDKVMWFKDQIELIGLFHNNKLLDLELPSFLNLKVIATIPGFKGNTVKAGVKPATLETNLIINVPLFINEGDIIKVDTRTKEYLGKA
ncbi:MAG: elongation factor P [Candidatus Omnitrophota bacterium]